jgi:hypothetical protein
MTFHKGKVFTKECKLPDWFLGKFITPKENKTTKEGYIYATSAAGFVAEVGVEEVAPVLGGGIDALVAGVEEVGVEVEEAAEGVIIDMMPSAYFFAFSKKPRSSERGQ